MDQKDDDINVVSNIFDINNLNPENDDGNIEYKYKLTNFTPEKMEKRTTQMKYRIDEGCGEAFYCIGVMDDGTPLGLNETEYNESVTNLHLIASKLECIVTKISESHNDNGYIGEFLVRESDTNKYVDLKIGVAGNVDSGKSTTIGTLTKGILDDGRGKARMHVFNYKHEIDSGRTSSIGHQIMGFDNDGNVVNSKFDRQPTWTEIVNQSNKVITFYDLAGHEKYLRTTIYGLTSIYPDYCIIMVGANMGVNHMTREHIGLCLTLKIPFIIIISKIDIVPQNILEENINKIHNICKNIIRKIPYQVKTPADVFTAVKNIKSESIIPIIQISNVTNHNLDLLKMMLNLLPVRNDYTEFINQSTEFLVDNTYSITGHPTIVAGMLRKGNVKIGDNLAVGPYMDGSFKSVKVKSIHCKFCEIKEARAGSYICMSLKNINRKEIKKGMVVVTDNDESKISKLQFWAFVNILHSPTTIKLGYQPFVHIDQIRQSVKIIEIKKLNKEQSESQDDILRTGDKANVKLEFMNKPEYIKPNMRLIFREGKVKAIGKVIEQQDKA